uniref:Protein TsetseEP domain-containing protein n=1 Tax=Graphocephala atropunctata TaxID=36148 RepID=A0A1B6LRC8_9HEMI
MSLYVAILMAMMMVELPLETGGDDLQYYTAAEAKIQELRNTLQVHQGEDNPCVRDAKKYLDFAPGYIKSCKTSVTATNELEACRGAAYYMPEIIQPFITQINNNCPLADLTEFIEN